MNWSKLADRCQLFVDGDKGLFIELLKEAEIELTRQANILEDEEDYTADGTNSFGLPSNFKQAIAVLCQGEKKRPMEDDEFFYKTDNTQHTGTPSGYTIRGNNLTFSQIPNSSDKIKLIYYSIVTVSDTIRPVIPELFHRDLCDYAIAIVSAKKYPELHNKFWSLWSNNIEKIRGEMGDREILYDMKEEI